MATEQVEDAVHRRRQLEYLRRRTRFDHGVLEAEVENEKKALVRPHDACGSSTCTLYSGDTCVPAARRMKPER